MSLKPPTDWSKPILFASVGVAASLVCFVFKADYLPRVGDNIHSLPHGGSYRDGTKSINYNGLKCIENSSVDPFHHSGKFLAFCSVIVLSVLIYVCSKYSNRSNRIHHFCVHHHNHQ
ncbi:triple gene block protein 2 [Cherry rusty mottle associated virus]|uniref:Movement protein TGB2 n=1 Tax=Cherry rusty mottle associated virus TaxID=1312929 RepID=M9QZ91_9VIRU|nr:triple gene block protein 2 [Cherry rusty mottle associated virus]AGI62180.1 triple gene block protein 2 [Cherry rusty mottle associated virus]UCJ00607.1 triple gene block 2 [Cherry rusty mottle associated virus]